MSCDIVPKEHIDVMCWALATFNNGAEYARTVMTLFHEDGVREYVKFLDIPRPHPAGMNRLGQILMEENYRSVNARYRENTPCPEYRWAPPVSDEWSCEEVLRAIRGYEYQSTAAGDWDKSLAKQVCDKVREACVDGICRAAERRCDRAFAWVIEPGDEPARPDPLCSLRPPVTCERDIDPLSGVLRGDELHVVELVTRGDMEALAEFADAQDFDLLTNTAEKLAALCLQVDAAEMSIERDRDAQWRGAEEPAPASDERGVGADAGEMGLGD